MRKAFFGKAAPGLLAAAACATAGIVWVAQAQDGCRSDQTGVWVNGRYVCRANPTQDGTAVRSTSGGRSPPMTGGAQGYPGAAPQGQQSGLAVTPQGAAGSTGRFDSPQQNYGGTVPAAQQQGLRVTPQGGYYMLPPPVQDLCLNLDGIQNPVPPGYVQDALTTKCYPGEACTPGTKYSAQKAEDYFGLGQDYCDGGDIIWMNYTCSADTPPTLSIGTNNKYDANGYWIQVTGLTFNRWGQFSNCFGHWTGTTTCDGVQCTTDTTMEIYLTQINYCSYQEVTCNICTPGQDGGCYVGTCTEGVMCPPPNHVVPGTYLGKMGSKFTYTTNIRP